MQFECAVEICMGPHDIHIANRKVVPWKINNHLIPEKPRNRQVTATLLKYAGRGTNKIQ